MLFNNNNQKNIQLSKIKRFPDNFEILVIIKKHICEKGFLLFCFTHSHFLHILKDVLKRVYFHHNL